NQRGHYSYDGDNWIPFDLLWRVDRLRWQNSTPFTQDEVWIARSWPFSVTQCGNWIESLLAAHPTKIKPTESAAALTPSSTTSFPAQDFIAAELASKVDELGNPVPATPLYAFEINDQAYSPWQTAV